jgi:hypothetical protein
MPRLTRKQVLRIGSTAASREEHLNKEILFRELNRVWYLLVLKYYGEEADVEVIIERATGQNHWSRRTGNVGV